MPNFSRTDPDDDDHVHKPAHDEVHEMVGPPPPPPPPRPVAVLPPVNPPSAPVTNTFQNSYRPPGAPIQQDPQVGLAQAAIDDKVTEHQLAKENEHWMKSYWRPAMGWLYMVICAFDFVIFPLITIILPILEHIIGGGIDLPYNAWQSLTLSNGGLIHMAFGAILGVAAFTRGQEKIAGKA